LHSRCNLRLLRSAKGRPKFGPTKQFPN